MAGGVYLAPSDPDSNGNQGTMISKDIVKK